MYTAAVLIQAMRLLLHIVLDIDTNMCCSSGVPTKLEHYRTYHHRVRADIQHILYGKSLINILAEGWW